MIDKNGYLHSGDLGVKDEQGFYKITGRIKDMIIRGGENIYPREIEEFLYHMPGIRDVQVAAVPSKKYGESSRCLYHPGRGCGDDARGCAAVLPRQDSPIQNSEVRVLYQGIPAHGIR